MGTTKHLYIVCRYFAAFMLLMYGFAKVNGSQFTVVDWVLDEPLGEVSGFWLTWHYFGYSTGYKFFIALTEIGGGILLLFRRTTLIGSLMMLGVMVNIVLIDIFFQINLGALLMAILITCSLLVIIGHHWDELVDLFWMKQNSAFGPGSAKRSIQITKWVVRSVIIVIPIIFTYYLAHHNNRSPTPIDGTWQVEQVDGEVDRENLPDRIYFEYNRAYQSRFRYSDSLSHDLHFIVDVEEGKLDIWEGWLRKDAKLFSGNYELQVDTLRITGMFDQKGDEADILLSRVR